MVLGRTSSGSAGVFGSLFEDDGTWLAFTLEHAFWTNYESWEAKIPPGTYTCVRGMHQLFGMAEQFETFEITEVPGHSGILFHVGNTNADSDGCVLLGQEMCGMRLTDSRIAFNSFMHLMDGVDSFQIKILEE